MRQLACQFLLLPVAALVVLMSRTFALTLFRQQLLLVVCPNTHGTPFYHQWMFTHFNVWPLYNISKGSSISRIDKATILLSLMQVHVARHVTIDFININYLVGSHPCLFVNLNMIDHEDIYKWLQASNWTKLIDVLHKNRDEIKLDSILQYAAGVFENEFLRQAGEQGASREIGDQLENLYVLHRGNFYKLKDENYLKLLAQLGRHNAGNHGEGYLRELKLLTTVKSKPKEVEPSTTEMSSRKFYDITTWTEIYNRIFQLISVQSDSSTYFPGPRFIGVVQEFKPFFPDYQQYRKIREQEGKSISRKDYFHDILKELDPNIRDMVITKILTMVRPFEPTAVSEIDRLMGVEAPLNGTGNSLPKNLLIFISYTWDNEPHKEWVLKLANRFISEGIDTIIDRHELRPGRNMPHFMERSIAKADKVLIIFTPGYKDKADNRTGGAGYEYSIMNADLYRNQTTNEKIIPILRAGSQQDSIPAFMRQFIYLDMSDDKVFLERYEELKKYICNEPIIEKPALGTSPSE